MNTGDTCAPIGSRQNNSWITTTSPSKKPSPPLPFQEDNIGAAQLRCGATATAAFSGTTGLFDVMAWVVDVSRCLGLVELKGSCHRPCASSASITPRASTQASPSATEIISEAAITKQTSNNSSSRNSSSSSISSTFSSEVTGGREEVEEGACTPAERSSPTQWHHCDAQDNAISDTSDTQPATICATADTRLVTTMAGDSPLQTSPIVAANTTRDVSPTPPSTLETPNIIDTSSVQQETASSELDNNIPAPTSTTPCKNKRSLGVFESVSTPCLRQQVCAAFREMGTTFSDFPNAMNTPVSSRLTVNADNEPNNVNNSENRRNTNSRSNNNGSLINISNSHIYNKFSLTQSCESLSPLSTLHASDNSTKYQDYSRLCRRRVILSRGDCTVQYSPVSNTGGNSLPVAGGSTATTPRSSLHARNSSIGSSPLIASEGRSALMSRVCGGTVSSVPPLPATEHPSRPPRINGVCHMHHHNSTSLLCPRNSNSQQQQQQQCSLLAGAGRNTTTPYHRHNNHPRRVVKSAIGLGEIALSDTTRSWSEHILARAGSVTVFPPFGENRTSSIRGPPSRAASAGYLLENLDLSEVSLVFSSVALVCYRRKQCNCGALVLVCTVILLLVSISYNSIIITAMLSI